MKATNFGSTILIKHRSKTGTSKNRLCRRAVAFNKTEILATCLIHSHHITVSSCKPHGSCLSTRSLWHLNVHHNTIRPLCVSNSISVRLPAGIEQSSFPLRLPPLFFFPQYHVKQNHAETPTMLALAGCTFTLLFFVSPCPFSSENGSAMYRSSSMTLRTKRARMAGHKTCHPFALETSFTLMLDDKTRRQKKRFSPFYFSFLLDHVASNIAVLISVLRAKKDRCVG